TLVQQLGDPSNWQLLKSTRSTVRITRFNLAWMGKIENESPLRSHNECLGFLIETLIRNRELALPASPEVVLADNRPVAIVGGAGVGKTLWIKEVLLPS